VKNQLAAFRLVNPRGVRGGGLFNESARAPGQDALEGGGVVRAGVGGEAAGAGRAGAGGEADRVREAHPAHAAHHALRRRGGRRGVGAARPAAHAGRLAPLPDVRGGQGGQARLRVERHHGPGGRAGQQRARLHLHRRAGGRAGRAAGRRREGPAGDAGAARRAGHQQEDGVEAGYRRVGRRAQGRQPHLLMRGTGFVGGGSAMDVRTWSIRAKLLVLVVGVAFAVGTVSAVYSYWSTGKLLLTQVEKRGRYIAENLGATTHFAVLTEDKVSLLSFIDSAMLAGATGAKDEQDVVGILIRDAKGAVLAQKGDAPRDLPAAPASAVAVRETLRERGEPAP